MSAARFTKAAMVQHLEKRIENLKYAMRHECGLEFDSRDGYSQCDGNDGLAWLYYGQIRLCLDLIDEIEGGCVK
jgi:hypothetical protein